MVAAVLALSAVVSATASAGEFTAESYPSTLVGSKGAVADSFNTTTGNVNCKSPSYHGTISAATTTILVTPTYAECTGFGFPATIDTNGCHYLFHIPAVGNVGTVDIVCTEGNEITVTASAAGTVKCTVHVPSQTVGGTITYANSGVGSTRQVTIAANLNSIDYTHTQGTGIGSCPGGSGAAGTLEGSGVVKGGSATHVGLFIS